VCSGAGAFGPGSKGEQSGPGRDRGDQRFILGHDDQHMIFKALDVQLPVGKRDLLCKLRFFDDKSLGMRIGRGDYLKQTRVELPAGQAQIGRNGIHSAEYKDETGKVVCATVEELIEARIKTDEGWKLPGGHSIS
jgi:hypothetical protein